MLSNIEKLALLYVKDRGYNWQNIIGDKYSARERDDVPTARLGKYPMKYGDVIRDGEYYVIGFNGELILDEFVYHDSPPHPMLEVWRVNPETGHFMYADYYDSGTTFIDQVWFDHSKYRNELINNFTVARKSGYTIITRNAFTIFYTYCIIHNTPFYIYIYQAPFRIEDNNVQEIKDGAINYFATDKGVYNTYMKEWDEGAIEDVKDLFPIEPEEVDQHPRILWLRLD